MAKKRKAAASTPEAIRERLLAERRAAVGELARLGSAPERDEAVGSGDSPFEAGDVAQASEQIDMSFAQRERVAGRINRLTRALERLAPRTYGVCEESERPVEPPRLAAMPGVAVCRRGPERAGQGPP